MEVCNAQSEALMFGILIILVHLLMGLLPLSVTWKRIDVMLTLTHTKAQAIKEEIIHKIKLRIHQELT